MVCMSFTPGCMKWRNHAEKHWPLSPPFRTNVCFKGTVQYFGDTQLQCVLPDTVCERRICFWCLNRYDGNKNLTSSPWWPGVYFRTQVEQTVSLIIKLWFQNIWSESVQHMRGEWKKPLSMELWYYSSPWQQVNKRQGLHFSPVTCWAVRWFAIGGSRDSYWPIHD